MTTQSTRRHFLSGLALGVSALSVSGLFAEELTRTPKQTEGPFYPEKLPLDTDNDLIVINDTLTPAVGEITHLSGRILDSRGNPIRNAVVEIWQCDNNGAYLHTKTGNADKRNRHFQGFGRFVAGRAGEYGFRTIKPVAYPGRTPHIHVAVKIPGQEKFVTQCYVKGHPGNEKEASCGISATTRPANRCWWTSRRSPILGSANWPLGSTSCWVSRRRTNPKPVEQNLRWCCLSSADRVSPADQPARDGLA